MPTGPRARAFAQVDVFSELPFHGNPVAVVLDGTDLSDLAMQQVARWTNLSETTFVLPPTTPGADYRLRIFTPGGELPFAGHPTLGSAHAWLEHGGVPAAPGHVVQQCQAGLVRVRLARNPAGTTELSFAAPPTLRSGPLDEQYLQAIVAALGISRDQVLDHQWVDNGPGWAVLRLPSAADVLALEPDFSDIPQAMVGVIGAHAPGGEHAFEMRSFAPGVGIAEDPVCGSMNASVAQWLYASAAVTGPYRVSQGHRLGRAGTITLNCDYEGQVWVGGAKGTAIRGSIEA